MATFAAALLPTATVTGLAVWLVARASPVLWATAAILLSGAVGLWAASRHVTRATDDALDVVRPVRRTSIRWVDIAGFVATVDGIVVVRTDAAVEAEPSFQAIDAALRRGGVVGFLGLVRHAGPSPWTVATNLHWVRHRRAAVRAEALVAALATTTAAHSGRDVEDLVALAGVGGAGRLLAAATPFPDAAIRRLRIAAAVRSWGPYAVLAIAGLLRSVAS
jgi:hypothetical protein